MTLEWRVRPSHSNGSARITPQAVEAAGPAVLTAVPARRRRLSDGTLVEATILARLLGIRLLKLDATLVLVPAEATVSRDASRYSLGRGSSQSSGVSPAPPSPVGRRLAEALRTIDEGRKLLAESERLRP